MRFWIISYGSGFFTVGPSLQLPVVDTPFHGLRDNAGGPGVCFFFGLQSYKTTSFLVDCTTLDHCLTVGDTSPSHTLQVTFFFLFFFHFQKIKRYNFFIYFWSIISIQIIYLFFFLKFTFSFTKIKGDKKNYMMSIKTHIVVVC